MNPRIQKHITNLILLLLVIFLPLVGAALHGRDLHALLAFPPRLAIPTDYPRFSWPAAGSIAAVVGFIAIAWCIGRRSTSTKPHSSPDGRVAAEEGTLRTFPGWGWLAVLWTAGWWLVAWTRFPALSFIQRYTFFPLWLGFILTVNASTQRRSGSCLLSRRPGRWLALFVASAVFWWVFEWLNRFVQNWHYLGVADFGPAAYAANATLCFSTVLPAVAGVAELLLTFRGWQSWVSQGPRWAWLGSRATGTALMAGGAVALLLTGAYPLWFYPALWSAPLALYLGEPLLSRRDGAARAMSRGDWGPIVTWMTAGLVCGFFWELWNVRSLAKWIYTVPGVDRWHVFEMPLLGYTGYLPFGLECLLVVERLGLLDGRFSWENQKPSK